MLNFVVALQAEAQPLIKAFALKRQPDSQAFPVYSSDGCKLVISGIGKCNSAAATTWLATVNSDNNSVWINAGIAGHADKPIGTAYCAHSIEDVAVSKTWYPVQIDSTLESLRLQTTDKPVANYRIDTLHDMEASGFFPTALRFSTAELVHCIKVISDNSLSPVSAITPSFVQRLLEDRIAEITHFTDHLLGLADELEAPDIQTMIDEFTKHWRFTVTQRQQLHRLLERHQLLLGNLDPLPSELRDLHSTSAVLAWLRDTVSAIPFEPAP